MQAARSRAVSEGRSTAEASERARAALLALHPSVPAQVADAALRGLEAVCTPTADPAQLRTASPEDLEAVLSYALRYDTRGRPLRGAMEFAAALAAERIADHIRRARLVVLKMPPLGPHGTG